MASSNQDELWTNKGITVNVMAVCSGLFGMGVYGVVWVRGGDDRVGVTMEWWGIGWCVWDWGWCRDDGVWGGGIWGEVYGESLITGTRRESLTDRKPSSGHRVSCNSQCHQVTSFSSSSQ